MHRDQAIYNRTFVQVVVGRAPGRLYGVAAAFPRDEDDAVSVVAEWLVPAVLTDDGHCVERPADAGDCQPVRLCGRRRAVDVEQRDQGAAGFEGPFGLTE